MVDTVISTQHLGKRYTIGHPASDQRYATLRGAIARGAANLLRNASDLLHGRPLIDGSEREDVWALRDVSFEVKRGEIVGVLGPNGAGKSTLLKILSRITEPTEGRASITGRVASLLEVGTGFHPELTGRENVFLNGVILGMSRADVAARLDDIVSFADVGAYLDTPVKRYSSGMYVRLAFSVAAHLDPDILVVDEVLAVGDVAFQKKCVGKMKESSADRGKTVLFVSHNVSAVRELCGRALVFRGGRLEFDGRTHEAIERYNGAQSVPTVIPSPAGDGARIETVGVEACGGGGTAAIPLGRAWRVRLAFRIDRAMQHFVAAVGLVNESGLPVQTAWTTPSTMAPGRYESVFTQEHVILAPGSYTVVAGLSECDKALHQAEAGRLHITAEHGVGYFQRSHGAGFVLNSMRVETTAV